MYSTCLAHRIARIKREITNTKLEYSRFLSKVITRDALPNILPFNFPALPLKHIQAQAEGAAGLIRKQESRISISNSRV